MSSAAAQTTRAYGVVDKTSPVAPMTIERRAPGPDDVAIEITYCGVCHTDIHMAHNDWGFSFYPVVPGHEIVGRVTSVGANVHKFTRGQLVGVGCLVDSCRHCASCKEGEEQFCETGGTLTYGAQDKKHGGVTFGGYSERITVDQAFVLHVPENLKVAGTPPLLCAGITMYSPLRHWNVHPGQKVGIVGLGGLGHMGVKLAAAIGAHVVMITTSSSKGADAKALGAADVLISKDAAALAQHANSFDLIIDTIPTKHDLNPYLGLLKRDKTLVVVGAADPLDLHGGSLIMKRRHVAGSAIGSIRETQELLDFCSKHNIVSDVEVIDPEYINEAYARMLRSDVKYRFVIDIEKLRAAKQA